jgi:hypothetical protein
VRPDGLLGWEETAGRLQIVAGARSRRFSSPCLPVRSRFMGATSSRAIDDCRLGYRPTVPRRMRRLEMFRSREESEKSRRSPTSRLSDSKVQGLRELLAHRKRREDLRPFPRDDRAAENAEPAEANDGVERNGAVAHVKGVVHVEGVDRHSERPTSF